jgi:hypothetical protein
MVKQRIRTWLTEVEPHAELLYRRAGTRFVALANEFLRSLTDSGDPSFEHLPRSLDPDAGFRAPRRFYFTDLMHLTGVNPIVSLADLVLTHRLAIEFVTRHVTLYAERLLTANSSRVTSDLRERLTESRRALESELRFMVKEISTSATRALKQAKEIRDRGEVAIASGLERLEQHRATLRELSGEAASHDDYPSS